MSHASDAPLLGDEAAAPGRRLWGQGSAGGLWKSTIMAPAVGLLLIGGMVVAALSPGDSGGAAIAAAVPVALAVVAPATGGKVQVDVYGMAGCPFTRAFVEGPLSETVTVASDLVDLRLHAYGNSYHITKECGGTADGYPFASYFAKYDQEVRECWDLKCGSWAKTPAEDCFDGPLLCQHGATDGMVTTAWACAKHLTNEDAVKYMPFVRCTSLHFLEVTSNSSYAKMVGSCASASGLDPEPLLSCATGVLGQQLYQAEARATVPHPAVPYVIIDGKELRDSSCVACGDGIMQKVCEAWRARGGQDTPTCRGIFNLI